MVLRSLGLFNLVYWVYDKKTSSDPTTTRGQEGEMRTNPYRLNLILQKSHA